jgi:hypothetical protein
MNERSQKQNPVVPRALGAAQQRFRFRNALARQPTRAPGPGFPGTGDGPWIQPAVRSILRRRPLRSAISGTRKVPPIRSLASSPSRSFARALALLALFAVAGCDDQRSSYRSPTAPDAPAAPVTPTATPAPPAADVSGAWSGTVTASWDEIDGGGSCAEPVTAEFEQRGSSFVGTLTDGTQCGPRQQIRFEGTIAGVVLSGSLIHADGMTWATSGRVVGDQMSFFSWNLTWELRR